MCLQTDVNPKASNWTTGDKVVDTGIRRGERIHTPEMGAGTARQVRK